MEMDFQDHGGSPSQALWINTLGLLIPNGSPVCHHILFGILENFTVWSLYFHWLSLFKHFKFVFIIIVCEHLYTSSSMCVLRCARGGGVKECLSGVSILLLPCEFQEFNSDNQTWWHAPLPTELPCQPLILTFDVEYIKSQGTVWTCVLSLNLLHRMSSGTVTAKSSAQFSICNLKLFMGRQLTPSDFQRSGKVDTRI